MDPPALQEAQAIPGVTTAAIASGIPLDGGAIGSVGSPGGGRNVTGRGHGSLPSADYFRVIGVPLLRGRALDAAEPRTVVIDQAAARAYFPGERSARQATQLFRHDPRTVAVWWGYAAESPAKAPPPHIYEPLDHDPVPYLKVLVRTTPSRGTRLTRCGAVRGVDPTVRSMRCRRSAPCSPSRSPRSGSTRCCLA